MNDKQVILFVKGLQLSLKTIQSLNLDLELIPTCSDMTVWKIKNASSRDQLYILKVDDSYWVSKIVQ